MNNISSVKNCANCGSCVSACPHGAVSIGGEGVFYAPKVDAGKCVGCGICLKSCPVTELPEVTKPVAAFGGWSSDSEQVLQSSSGGVFGELARYVTDNGGVVFGAAYAADCRSVRFSSSDDVPLQDLKKSKYVESLAGDVFSEIRRELQNGRQVLFCGTPCQAAGLRRYIGNGAENLIVCDFACGGLPSHRIYAAYLEELEKKYRSKVVSVDFRPKTHGWSNHSVAVRFENGKTYCRLGTEDPYMRAFLYGKLSVRGNCLTCPFAVRHASDVSLADFWLHKKYSALQNEDGISLVLCNTEKGRQLMDAISDRLHTEPVDLDKAVYNNTEHTVSKQEAQRHDAFISAFETSGFAQACREFEHVSVKNRAKNLVRRHLLKKGSHK